jgi:hypothetical protein
VISTGCLRRRTTCCHLRHLQRRDLSHCRPRRAVRRSGPHTKSKNKSRLPGGTRHPPSRPSVPAAEEEGARLLRWKRGKESPSRSAPRANPTAWVVEEGRDASLPTDPGRIPRRRWWRRAVTPPVEPYASSTGR